MDEMHARIVAQLEQQGGQELLIQMLNNDNEQRRRLDQMMDAIERRDVWIRRTFWPAVLFFAVAFAALVWRSRA